MGLRSGVLSSLRPLSNKISQNNFSLLAVPLLTTWAQSRINNFYDMDCVHAARKKLCTQHSALIILPLNQTSVHTAPCSVNPFEWACTMSPNFGSYAPDIGTTVGGGNTIVGMRGTDDSGCISKFVAGLVALACDDADSDILSDAGDIGTML